VPFPRLGSESTNNNNDEANNHQQQEEKEEDATIVSSSVKDFVELGKFIGTKLTVDLKGSDNFTEWEYMLTRAIQRLQCSGVLHVSKQLWYQMKGTVEDLILNSIPANDKAELYAMSAGAMLDALRSRYALRGAAESAMALLKIKQGTINT
jgi:hypothetical protein